jgi:hypothetical protein
MIVRIRAAQDNRITSKNMLPGDHSAEEAEQQDSGQAEHMLPGCKL